MLQNVHSQRSMTASLNHVIFDNRYSCWVYVTFSTLGEIKMIDPLYTLPLCSNSAHLACIQVLALAVASDLISLAVLSVFDGSISEPQMPRTVSSL
jgi:hypothetical protein